MFVDCCGILIFVVLINKLLIGFWGDELVIVKIVLFLFRSCVIIGVFLFFWLFLEFFCNFCVDLMKIFGVVLIVCLLLFCFFCFLDIGFIFILSNCFFCILLVGGGGLCWFWGILSVILNCFLSFCVFRIGGLLFLLLFMLNMCIVLCFWIIFMGFDMV